jgi:hypothetical protein
LFGASRGRPQNTIRYAPWSSAVETLEYQSTPPPPTLPRVFISRRVVPFVVASVVLFLASLTQPAMRLDGSTTGQRWECLLLLCIGWIGLFGRVYAWLANPALFAGWVLLVVRRSGRGAVMLVISLGFALSFLRETHWERDESGSHTATITGHAIGYWLWIASIATALVGCLVAMVFDRRAPLSRSRAGA